jgi:hypothetical protein
MGLPLTVSPLWTQNHFLTQTRQTDYRHTQSDKDVAADGVADRLTFHSNLSKDFSWLKYEQNTLHAHCST